MKSSLFQLWHFGFFFWILGLGIYSVPSFADLAEYEIGKIAFQYLIHKKNIAQSENQLLLSSMKMGKQLSVSETEDIPAMHLHAQNRAFLLEKNTNITLPVFSDDIKIQKDAEFFVRLDVWDYVSGFDDRERGTNQYIEWGKMLLTAIARNTTQKDARIAELKALLEEQKKLLATATKNYSDMVLAGDAVGIEKYKAEKASIASEISVLESLLEEISKRTKSLSVLQKDIQKMVLGAEENRDALIKNVKVKSPSGSYIKAIETK